MEHITIVRSDERGTEPTIERYPDRTRINHWLVALLFIPPVLYF